MVEIFLPLLHTKYRDFCYCEAIRIEEFHVHSNSELSYIQSDYIYKCYDVQGQLIALKKWVYDEV